MNKLFYEDLQFNLKSIFDDELNYFNNKTGLVLKNKNKTNTINYENYQKYNKFNSFTSYGYIKKNNQYKNSFDLYNNINYRGFGNNINNFSKIIKLKNLNNITDLGLDFEIINNIPNMTYINSEINNNSAVGKRLYNSDIDNMDIKNTNSFDLNLINKTNLGYLNSNSGNAYGFVEKNELKNYIYVKKKIEHNVADDQNKKNNYTFDSDVPDSISTSSRNLKHTMSEFELFNDNEYENNLNIDYFNISDLPPYYENSTNNDNFTPDTNINMQNKKITDIDIFSISGNSTSVKSGNYNKNFINIFEILGSRLVDELYSTLSINEITNQGSINNLSNIFYETRNR